MIVCDAASEGQVLRGTGKKLILEEDRTIGTPVSHLEEEEEEGKIRLVSRKKRAKDSQTDISRLERKRTSDDRYRDNKATYVYIYIYIYIYVYVYTCTHIRARWSASKPKTYCAFHDDARRFKRAKRAKQRERKERKQTNENREKVQVSSNCTYFGTFRETIFFRLLNFSSKLSSLCFFLIDRTEPRRGGEGGGGGSTIFIR